MIPRVSVPSVSSCKTREAWREHVRVRVSVKGEQEATEQTEGGEVDPTGLRSLC